MDVKFPFPNCDLQEEVFMELLLFKIPILEKKVLTLCGVLFRLHQTLRPWYQWMDFSWRVDFRIGHTSIAHYIKAKGN